MIIIPSDVKPGDHMYFSWETDKGKTGKKQTSVGYEVVIKSYDDSHLCFHSVMGNYDMYFQKDLMLRLDGTLRHT